MQTNRNVLIKLTVNNHPGVMSHITGLFSRRGFNLEGILCGTIGNGEKSEMFLLVRNDNRLAQITAQLDKLYDVLEVEQRETYNPEVFNRIEELV